jgi:glycosyl transferase family 2
MSPSLTAWPSCTTISFTTPASSASTGISIFIDSRITTVSPSSTESPGETSIFQTVPVMCASISATWALQSVAGTASAPEYPAVSIEPDTPQAAPARVVIVTARDEADRIVATIEAAREAFPGARVVVAESGSRDATSVLAERAGAEVVRTDNRRRGKGASATTAARAALARVPPETTFVLCDGDLGASAARLGPLAQAVEQGRCELAVAAFSRRLGGGFGLAVGFSRWAIRNLTGVDTTAPISGQRAMRADVLARLLPFADGFGMETGMTVDALRAGCRLEEIEIDLEHRATGRTLGGFLHRARQLASFVRVYLSRKVRSSR